MRNKFARFLFTVLAVAMMVFLSKTDTRAAMTDNPNIKAHYYNGNVYWTIEETLPVTYTLLQFRDDVNISNSIPYWYEIGTTVYSGIESSLRSPVEGEHYYEWDRTGEIPVGKLVVTWKQGRDIHDSFLDETGRLL